jgi:hypothetical protein
MNVIITVRFEDFSTVYVQIMFFGLVPPFSSVGKYRRFREAGPLDLNDTFMWKISAEINRIFRLITSTPKIEAALVSTDKTT